MPRLLAPPLAALLALALLAACQLSLPGRDRAPDAAASPVAGGAITTTTLDAAPAPTTPPVTAPVSPPASAATAASATDPRPQPRPETNAATTTAATGAETAATPTDPPAETTPEIPAPLKSPSQIACEDDGGRWARAGEGGGMACVYQTRDGGQRCDSKSDCDGECLARSRTCSPIQPLFGCNAVLLDTGAEVTLCLD